MCDTICTVCFSLCDNVELYKIIKAKISQVNLNVHVYSFKITDVEILNHELVLHVIIIYRLLAELNYT